MIDVLRALFCSPKYSYLEWCRAPYRTPNLIDLAVVGQRIAPPKYHCEVPSGTFMNPVFFKPIYPLVATMRHPIKMGP